MNNNWSLTLLLLVIDAYIFVIALLKLWIIMSKVQGRRFLLSAPFLQILFIIVDLGNFQIHAVKDALG